MLGDWNVVDGEYDGFLSHHRHGILDKGKINRVFIYIIPCSEERVKLPGQIQFDLLSLRPLLQHQGRNQ